MKEGESVSVVAKYKPKLEVVADEKDLARRSLDLFVKSAQKAIESKGNFFVAISGGQTPRHFFELLGDDERSQSLAWNKIQLFWVDERIVDPNSPWSNYKLAADTFLGNVPIPAENVHKIPTDEANFESAARHYEQAICKAFGLRKGQLPKFDLIVLGMGADGHTGSLFANSYAPFDKDDLACVVYVMDDKLNRITLTHPVLCAASQIIVLVSGPEKAKILKEVLTNEPDEVRYPIHTLWPAIDKVTWLVDKDAARLLGTV